MKPRTLRREPSGRRSRADQKRERAPTAIRRLIDAALEKFVDEKWGTELGRLALYGQIDETMFLAGQKWTEGVIRYYAAISVPRQPRSASLERGSFAHDPDPDSEGGKIVVLRDHMAIQKFEQAHSALMSAGKLPEWAVRTVCEHNENIGAWNVNLLRVGLMRLAHHWHLTKHA